MRTPLALASALLAAGCLALPAAATANGPEAEPAAAEASAIDPEPSLAARQALGRQMALDLQRLHERSVQALAEIQAAMPDAAPAEFVRLQQQLQEQKLRTAVEQLQIQARYARFAGNRVLADRLEAVAMSRLEARPQALLPGHPADEEAQR